MPDARPDILSIEDDVLPDAVRGARALPHLRRAALEGRALSAGPRSRIGPEGTPS